jgi:pathogenesis-related protein 1
MHKKVSIEIFVILVTASIVTVPSSVIQVSYAQTNQDLANNILAVHNSERAAVGVPPLVWNDELAAGAQTWAEHLATTGQFNHASFPDKPNDVGENLAGFFKGVSVPGEGQSLWVDEKKDYHGQPIPFTSEEFVGPPPYPAHYTQMVWQSTTEVGCGTASGGGHPFSILVCRYSPAGNFLGQTPFGPGAAAPPANQSTEAAPPANQSTEAAPPANQSTEAAPPANQSTEAAPPANQSTEAAPPANQSTEAAPPANQSTEAAPPANQSTEAAPPEAAPEEQPQPQFAAPQQGEQQCLPGELFNPDTGLCEVPPVAAPQQAEPVEEQPSAAPIPGTEQPTENGDNDGGDGDGN